jgi:hypothetical protein
MRLPNFHSDVDAENYSPQVEKLLAEWDADHAATLESVELRKEPELSQPDMAVAA